MTASQKVAANQEWLTAEHSDSKNGRQPKVAAVKCDCPSNLAAKQKCLTLSSTFLCSALLNMLSRQINLSNLEPPKS